MSSPDHRNRGGQGATEGAAEARSPDTLLNLGSQAYLVEFFPLAAYAVRAPDGVIAWFNSRAAELWGRTPAPGDTDERFCGAYKLYNPDGSLMAPGETPVALALKTGVSVHERDVVVERPDGNRVVVSVHVDPIRDRGGEIVGAVNFFQDVSERQQAARAIGLLAAIVDSSDDAIVSKNLDGTITSWNNGAARLFGYTAEEAVGRNITLIVPQDRLHEEATILGRLRRGERVDHFETVRVRKDGTMLDLSLTISPVKDADGRIVGASKVARDITERKRSERVRSEQARLLDLSSDAILVRDAGDRVTYWNHAASELYGFSPEEALGRVTHELLRTEFPETLESIRKQLHQHDRWTGELVHTTKDGRQIVVTSRWVIDRDEQDNLRSTLETNSDITEHKHVEETRKESELSARLLQLQDEERRRIARELHDGVGQLLAAMSMNVSRVVREKSNLSPEAARCAEESKQLVGQVSKDIRTVSYLLHPPLLDEMGLQSALKWYVDGFADRSKIAAKLELPTDLGRMSRVHELCLFRVAQETLTNIHLHSGSSTALIKLFRTPGKITMEVADTGRGVSHETQRRIASGESVGVGLRGMRERIKQLGGTLEIHVNDQGTTVIATLPHAEAAP